MTRAIPSSDANEVDIYNLKIVGCSRSVQDGTVAYVIRITTSTGVKVLHRRFSEFVTLRDQVLGELRKRRTTHRTHEKVKKHQFPSRFVLPFTSKSNRVIAERTHQLEKFLGILWKVVNHEKLQFVSINARINLMKVLNQFFQVGQADLNDARAFSLSCTNANSRFRARSHMYPILEMHQALLRSF